MGRNRKTLKSNGLLWELRHPNSDVVNYLFGTMHVDSGAYASKLLNLEPYFNKCQKLFLEFDLSEQDSILFTKTTTLNSQQELPLHLSPGVWSKLRQICKKHINLSEDVIRQTHPLILSNMLATAQFRNTGASAIDLLLFENAQSNEMSIGGLETFEEQLAVFSQIDMKEQYMRLKRLATNFKGFSRDVLRMKAAYDREDVEYLHKLAKRTTGGLRRVLIYDRNKRMAERIVPILEDGNVFIAVGAGHLGGHKGLIASLKRKGVQLSPISLF